MEEKIKEEKSIKKPKVKKVDKHAEEINEIKDKLVRLQAEFENYKKRSKTELEDMAKYGSQELMTPLLGVIDNFERALSVKPDSNSIDKYTEGVDMIYKQLLEILCACGLERIEAEGQCFNPGYHQGVMNEVVEDDEMVDKVVAEFQKGYMLNKKVIRPTMVKIGIKG
ncbi:MAG: molecular chaperone GrpE [Fusobacteria bacterium]|nr:MAG: molecular chaperone GrpE [Fusobacteriota bacterium]KAF0229725.1 MAG: molecular chaperone [Fusobacteriota bacterium]